MSDNQITARIGATNIEYRRRATFERNMSKVEFDTEVYDFYREHHPMDTVDDTVDGTATDTATPLRKDNT